MQHYHYNNLKSDKLVSIMIPTYNQENYIEATILSALEQTYQNIEIIISDDCSTDRTGEIAQKYCSDKVKYYRNDSNKGRVANYRLTLYERVLGDYVVNLDGDDVFVDKNFIIDAINLFKVFNEEPVCLIASRQRNDAIKTKHNIETEYLRISGIDYVTNIQDKYIFSHLTTIYDRKLAKNLNFYSKNIISSDMESILRLALTGDVIVTQRVAGQWNRTKNNASRNAELLESLENHIWIDSVYEELKKLISIKEYTNWKSRVEIKWCLPIVYQHVILGRFRIQSIYKIFQEGHLLLMFRCVYLLLKDKIQSFINKKNV